MKIVYIVWALIALIAVWFVSTANGLRRRVVRIDESLSDIDVALTKRYDSLTKIAQIAKAFAGHETELLSKVIELRAGATMQQRREALQATNELAGRINVLAEAYPELRSSENYRQLQLAVADAEEHLQAARRLYNSNVSGYNQALVTFPRSVVASILGMGKREFFRADEQKKEDVTLDI